MSTITLRIVDPSKDIPLPHSMTAEPSGLTLGAAIQSALDQLPVSTCVYCGATDLAVNAIKNWHDLWNEDKSAGFCSVDCALEGRIDD